MIQFCRATTQNYIEIYLVDWNILPTFVAVLLKYIFESSIKTYRFYSNRDLCEAS